MVKFIVHVLMKHVSSWSSVTEAGAAAFINTNIISTVCKKRRKKI